MTAQTVFSAALQHIKQCVKRHIEETTGGHVLQPTDVLYVLTVPAIWDDAAKTFMRECAYKAGLIGRDDPDRLLLALEPEVAGIYCRKLPAADLVGAAKDLKEPMPGDSYVIVDAGGGTVDIAVHEIDTMGNVREIYQPTGGPWGGKLCNESFMALLGEIFGVDVITHLTNHSPAGYAEMLTIIEDAKRGCQPSGGDRMNIRLNYHLRQAVQKCGTSVEDAVQHYNGRHKVELEYESEALELPSAMVMSVLDEAIDKIIEHLTDLLQKPKVKYVSRILLVGGFSECQHLQNRVRESFGSKLQVLVPAEGGLAVLRGAVMFGRNPAVVQQRVARFTYGINASPRFVEGKHMEEKKVYRDGIARCKGVFRPLVEMGDPLQLGHTVEKTSFPTSLKNKDMAFLLFCVPGNPEYVTDEGVKQIGELNITFPEAQKERTENTVSHIYCFGLTELHVLLIHHESGDFITNKFGFLPDAENPKKV